MADAVGSGARARAMASRLRDEAAWRSLGLPARGATQVVVVGGGIAGAAAALAARRGGAGVTLLEKEIALGGLATLGNVVVYLPLCDGNGRQVMGGIAEELLRLAVTAEGCPPPGLVPDRLRVPDCWARPADVEERRRQRYLVELNPASYILSLEELLLREGVNLAYDTRFVDVVMDRGRIAAVVAADKGGLHTIPCLSVVDASGDADVCVAAGEEIVSCSGNVSAGWFYHFRGDKVGMERLSQRFSRDPHEVLHGSTGFACQDGASVTAQVVTYRDLVRARLRELDAQPLLLPMLPCFRMTRRLHGRAEPSAAAALEPCAELIGLASDWRAAGPVYHLAYGTLLGRAPNLLVAGRCVSVGDDLWDATRAIPVCALTGEAAGVAAALSLAAGVDPAAVDVGELQEALRARGGILPL
jgi:hypothetical protein